MACPGRPDLIPGATALTQRASLPLRLLAGLAGTLALGHAVLLFGLVGENEVLALLGIGLAAFALPRPRLSLALSLGTLAAALLLAALVWAAGLDAKAVRSTPLAELITYDFRHGHQVFRPNARVSFTVPFGDLAAMRGRDLGVGPRTVHFSADSRGLRNDADYAAQPWLLLGDSFVVASATDQVHTLSEFLKLEHGVDVYNVAAVGGDLADYGHWLDEFFQLHPDSPAKAVVFFFEGNDFGPVRDAKAATPAWRLWLKRYVNLYRFMPLGKLCTVLVGRLRARDRDDPVLDASAGGLPIHFLKRYAEVAARPAYPNPGEFRDILAAMRPRLAAAVFIPEKYRVYAPFLDQPTGDLPNAQWAYLSGLCADLDLPCLDLTPALRTAAGRLLPRGEFAYWPDDTHWNAAGIRAAAAALAPFLDGLPEAAP
ncbi:MAG: hypothetical protein AB1916_06245 [Thermodesulfobacteriota bacterium]